MIIYNVNEEKGTVVARFEGDREYWRICLFDMIDNILDPTLTVSPIGIVDKVLDGYTDFVGKAKLSPADTWSKEEGKRIAKKRLLDKWYRVKDRVLDELRDAMYKNHNEIIERIDRKMLKVY